MNIVVSSIDNTGGEWLEMAVKAICSIYGSIYNPSEMFFDKDNANSCDFVIFKADNFKIEYALSSVILTTSRCPLELNFEDYEKGTIINKYYQQSIFNEYSNKCIKYDTIINDELLAIQEVAFALNLKCSSKDIQKKINNEEKYKNQAVK